MSEVSFRSSCQQWLSTSVLYTSLLSLHSVQSVSLSRSCQLIGCKSSYRNALNAVSHVSLPETPVNRSNYFTQVNPTHWRMLPAAKWTGHWESSALLSTC